MIVHIPTKTVVATPFVNFQLCEEAAVDPDEIVEVTEKIDGSLGIGFMWKGKVYLSNYLFLFIFSCVDFSLLSRHVSTRNRLNSYQAMWATEWLRHTNTTILQEGWTYLFEIVYPDNRNVITYPYSGYDRAS